MHRTQRQLVVLIHDFSTGTDQGFFANIVLQDMSGLKRFQSVAGDRLKMGVLFYDGDHTTAFGDKLYAVPVGALWS